MKLLACFGRPVSALLTLALACTFLVPTAAYAADTTGTIQGTVTDKASGAPLAGVTVTAKSPSQGASATTDSKGFYVIQDLLPDTYTVSFSREGYTTADIQGVVVFQTNVSQVNNTLQAGLSVIAHTHSASSSSLVKPDVTSDTWTVSADQLNALALGNDSHKTLYQYVGMIPGIGGSSYGSQPRVHGGSAADISYEFDGVPINDEITGLFTTNLSTMGIGSLVVTTGGLTASQGSSGIGIINTVVKSGTYPGFANLQYTATSQYRNIYEEGEYGGATRNGKFSWFLSVDNTDALNEFTSGQTYPLFVIEQANGPGKITTTDINANFHFRPTAKDDIQLLIQNGLGEFNWSYLMQRAPGEPQPLTYNECAGAQAYTLAQVTTVPVYSGPNYFSKTTPYSSTYSGGYGGTAPNGAYCPEGIYFGSLTDNGLNGNIWHHYSGIGKLQWNHIINEHSSVTLRVSENYNSYIFAQPFVEPNLPQFENNNSVGLGTFSYWNNNYQGNLGSNMLYHVDQTCPNMPYTAGTPVASGTYNFNSTNTVFRDTACSVESGYVSTGYYQDRSSRIWSGDLIYDNTVNANLDYEVGVGTSTSPDVDDVYYTGWFNATDAAGSPSDIWPALNYSSTYPVKTSYAYAQGDIQLGKLRLSPGLRFTQRNYDYPGFTGQQWVPGTGTAGTGAPQYTTVAVGGGATSRGWSPTISVNYAFGRKDVLIGAASDTVSLPVSYVVYRDTPASMLNGPRQGSLYYCGPQNPASCSHPPELSLNHSYYLMWEHTLGPSTSFKIGPYFNETTNFLTNYTPMYLDNTTTPPQWLPIQGQAQGVQANNGIRKSTGLEFGLNHDDPRPAGVGYWVAATWNNFWTNTLSSVTTPYGSVSVPPSVVGAPYRSSADPAFTGSITLDAHDNRLHFYPQWYFQGPITWYLTTAVNVQTGAVTLTPEQTMGWGQLNATVAVDLGGAKDWQVGIQGTNILNNNNPTIPSCTAAASNIAAANLGYGCGVYRPVGATSSAPGANPSGWQFITVNQSSPLFFFFITKKM
jgi:hypothetical protein